MNITLPAWAAEKNVYVFAGIECVGVRLSATGEVYVKTVRCNRCGECCKVAEGESHFMPVVDGHCIHLVEEFEGSETKMCGLGALRPLQCGIDIPGGEIPECCMRWTLQE